MFTKAETNNAIVVKLTNVRKHPNADRLQLASVLGTTVIVDLTVKNDDLMIYFDSNLALCSKYLHENNLYIEAGKNKDTTKRGYFSSTGRVKAQIFRGEKSNGYVAPIQSLSFIENLDISKFIQGVEFQSINDINICFKYIAPNTFINNQTSSNKPKNKQKQIVSEMFKEHWETKNFFRCNELIAKGMIYIEEKEHGTSGRSILGKIKRPLKWYEKVLSKFGITISTESWEYYNGSRRVVLRNNDGTDYRSIIFNKLKPNMLKGQELYYEISGYGTNGSMIQKDFPYGCNRNEQRVMLYRVTENMEDGRILDRSREYVYNRADELGLQRPKLLQQYYFDGSDESRKRLTEIIEYYTTDVTHSFIDKNTIFEGVVVWFENNKGQWSCLKAKSFEFLNKESKLKDSEEYVDVEDLS